MKGYTIAIETETSANTNFRRVLYTSKHSQLVLMNLRPGEDIGLESHTDCDQFFRIGNGEGKCLIDGVETDVRDGDAIVVPAGAKHNLINLSENNDLKLYTVYSAPNHKDGVIRETKLDAQDRPEKYDGVTTETYSGEHPESKHIAGNQTDKIEVKVSGKIHMPKLNRREKKMLKLTKNISKRQVNIDKLNKKMSKLHLVK